MSSLLPDRIQRRLAVTGMSPTELCRALGISKQSCGAWKSGKVKDLRMENLVRAADVLGCEIRWLAVGIGPEEPEELTAAQAAVLEAMRQMTPAQAQALVGVATALAGQRSAADDCEASGSA